MTEFMKLRGKERTDFLQAKYEYYRTFNTWVVILSCVASLTYFISDCQLFGRFAKETLIPRFFILIPLTVFLIVNKKCRNYRIMSIFSLLMAHMIMWCTIWAIYYLPIKTHASEGFIIMHLVFLVVAYCSPFTYSTISHCCLILNILVSNLFNHYENLNIMLSLGIPCVVAITASNLVMCNVSYDNYITKKTLESSLVIDPLTNIYNRNILPNITRDEKFSFVRSENISVLMIDIDFFKHVNDTYGHDKGDIVLKSIASVIRSCTRGGDYAIRWGGEEFVVIMPECPIKEAFTVAERIRTRVAEFDNTVCPVTISIGIAEYDHENYENAIQRADKALYAAKLTGRNKVISYSKGDTTDVLTSNRQ